MIASCAKTLGSSDVVSTGSAGEHEKTSSFRVDVVILSWNRTQDTLAAIASARAQNDVDTTIWVVDQGSGAECVQALRKRKNAGQIKLIELARNLGVGGGRNVGMSQGSAPYIVCLDNDAVFADPDSLAKVGECFAAQENIGAIGFRVLNYFSGEEDWRSWVYPRSLKSSCSKGFVTTRYPGGASALRRTALEQTDLYDEKLFFYWEEIDLAYQLIQLGYHVVYNPDIKVRHKVSPEAKVDWSGSRFYYLVRNALYVDYKYYRSLWRVVVRGGAYLIKGLRNGVAPQVFRAWRDCAVMLGKTKVRQAPLSSDARRYIYEHELRYRESLWRRLRDEVLEVLP